VKLRRAALPDLEDGVHTSDVANSDRSPVRLAPSLSRANPSELVAALLDPAPARKHETAAWARVNLPGRSHEFDRRRWRLAASHGILGLSVPATYGGSALSTVETLLAFEGLGLGCEDTGLVFSLASQVFAFQTALLAAGNDAQRERWLPPLVHGDNIGSFAMSEPAVGSNTAAISTTATADGDGWIIDGTKAWVTLGPVCDVVLVFATVDASKGRWGITAFLVPSDTQGVEIGPVITKSGLHSCPFGTMTFNRCRIGADAVVGQVGSGAAVFTAAVEAERAFLYAAQLGTVERVITRTIDRARERQQFGQAIGTFQAVAHRVVDMKLRHECARLLIYKAAALHDRGDAVTMAAALAKLAASEGAVQSALDAVRIHGAEGYTEAGGLELDLRDAVGGLAYSGTSDIQRNLIARLLGVDRPTRHQPGGPT
jgi:hypothetical protein